MSRFNFKADSGLTLLETLVSLAIMAGIAGIAATSIKKPSDQLRLQEQAASLAREMIDIRSEAISENLKKTVNISSGVCGDPIIVTFFANGMAKGEDICLKSGELSLLLTLNPLTGRYLKGDVYAVK